MNLRIGLSRQAEKFLARNQIPQNEIFSAIKDAVGKFRGEDINVNIKKLSGKWEGFHRIRKGKLRIIAEFKFDHFVVFIEVIDWRGGAYK
ncbi:MAG: hypothetical protein Q7S12_02085 [bacterium]|nr:hypothetical protein [bacterium]